MNTRRYLSFAIVITLFLLAAACSVNTEDGEPAGNSSDTYEQLLVSLQDAGFEVETSASITQPFFEPEARIITAGGQEMQVFEFPSEEEAVSAAGTISADGGSIGTSMVTWIKPPHFFSSGRLILIYLGEDAAFISSLEELLGAQIAGR
jgi:hypothetical protein